MSHNVVPQQLLFTALVFQTLIMMRRLKQRRNKGRTTLLCILDNCLHSRMVFLSIKLDKSPLLFTGQLVTVFFWFYQWCKRDPRESVLCSIGLERWPWFQIWKRQLKWPALRWPDGQLDAWPGVADILPPACHGLSPPQVSHPWHLVTVRQWALWVFEESLLNIDLQFSGFKLLMADKDWSSASMFQLTNCFYLYSPTLTGVDKC